MRQRMLRAAEPMPMEPAEQLEEQSLRGRKEPDAQKTKRRKRQERKAPEPQPQAAPESAPRPVHTFRDRTIETSIWLNLPAHPLDPPDWRVTQRRFVPTPTGIIYARSLRPEDLDPARWGLYQARRWVKKMERRASFRSLLSR